MRLKRDVPVYRKHGDLAQVALFCLAIFVVFYLPFQWAFGGASALVNGAVQTFIFAAFVGVHAFWRLWKNEPRIHTALDMIAAIPWSYAFGPTADLIRLVCFHRARSMKLLSRTAIIRLASLFLTLVLCGHLVGCAWFALGASEGFKSEWGPPAEFLEISLGMRYGRSFFFALKSLTQGPDGVPGTPLELLLSLVIMFLGFSVYATIIGSIGSILLSLDTDSLVWSQLFDDVSRFVSSNDLPRPLARRVVDHFNYQRSYRKSASASQEVFTALPYSLQTDISLHLTRHLLSEVSFFKGK